MSLTTCILHSTKDIKKTVFFSNELARALQLTKSKTILLRVGSKSVSVPLKFSKRAGQHLFIPASVISNLRIPRLGTCMIKSTNGKEIQLGPVIGVLTTIASHSGNPFGARTSFIKQILRTGQNKSFFIAFGPHDVNWQEETVNAYILTTGGRFIRKVVPVPDVVYNRIASRKVESQAITRDFKESFVRRNIPLFNWSFFDKSDVYNLLKHDETFTHVPESITNPTSTKLKEMLKTYRFVYLKPTAGSLGFGIYRITYHPGKGYFIRYRNHGKNILLRYSNFDGILKMLRMNHGGMNRYIAQQGIRLIEIDHCPIDFRFHMTKNANNRWEVAAIGAKKAGRGSVTTHIRTGGSLFSPEQVLKEVFGSRADVVLSSTKETVIRLAEAIERNYPHRLGELGFDIGIDQNEKIWMFEANSKPGRTIFKHPSLKEQEKVSLENIYEHCLFLSRFRARREE
ncbi:YheC/YheD family protein [Paenibacillus albiflavus]|uniref:YheC/YheD family protein n=1 Tax=Paenibacillus albiflavus TaxID=2545760 RepID=A0A4V6P699_9BACL|nr:YheC/YheD family protein [Paenibacillus albiflavus]TCZ75322.1 YheC/YheD family protein [Paenibacillus albiflavus]